MEKADNILTVPGDFGWADVGSWEDAYSVAAERDGNFVLGDSDGRVVALDSEGCLFQTSGRLVAGIGLRDLVVVEMPDVVLICPRSRAQEVRRLVERLRDCDSDGLV
jgi:mannose-1-phosphate guanylyltransferase